MTIATLNRISLRVTLGCVAAATAFGLAAIWIEPIWRSSYTPRLWLTVGLLFSAACATTLITGTYSSTTKEEK